MYKNYVVVYGKVFSDIDTHKIDSDIEKIKEFSSSIFKSKNINHTIINIKDDIVFLLNFDSKTGGTTNQSVAVVEAFRRNIEQYFDVSIMLGVSKVQTDIMMVPKMVEQAETACEECFFTEKKISYYSAIAKTNIVEEINVQTDLVRKYVMDENFKELNKYIDLCLDEAFSTHDKRVIRKVFIDFISYAKIMYYENEHFEDAELKFRYSYFDKIMDFVSIKKYVKDVYEFITVRNNNETYSYSIKKSIKYIKDNYNRNITLEDVAEYANISKSYLSLLFKQESGINFSSYLTNYRIEKSMQLLNESNYKIYEIAEKVGFDNPYYFSKVFKEKTGLSCKDFRKKGL